jgi:hypothetical protein
MKNERFAPRIIWNFYYGGAEEVSILYAISTKCSAMKSLGKMSVAQLVQLAGAELTWIMA